MVRLTAPLVLLVVAAGAARAAGAGDASAWPAIVAEALEAYDEGMSRLRSEPEAARAAFRRAAERLEFVVEEGLVNGPILYDLGNAQLQSGDLGRAIAAYRGAELLMPGDDRLQSNLAYARSLCRTRIERAGQRQLLEALLRWHSSLTLTTRWVLGLVAWCGFWIILTIHQLHRLPGSRSTAAVLLVLWLALGVSIGVDLTGTAGARHGVLIEDGVAVRKGGGPGYDRQFAEPLHAGVEVRIRSDRGEWLEIALPNGRTGWVRSGQVVRLQTGGPGPL